MRSSSGTWKTCSRLPRLCSGSFQTRRCLTQVTTRRLWELKKPKSLRRPDLKRTELFWGAAKLSQARDASGNVPARGSRGP